MGSCDSSKNKDYSRQSEKISMEKYNKEKNNIYQKNIKEVQTNYPKNIPLISNKAQNYMQTNNPKIQNQTESNNGQVSLSEKVSNLDYNKGYNHKSSYDNKLKNVPIFNKSNS